MLVGVWGLAFGRAGEISAGMPLVWEPNLYLSLVRGWVGEEGPETNSVRLRVQGLGFRVSFIGC